MRYEVKLYVVRIESVVVEADELGEAIKLAEDKAIAAGQNDKSFAGLDTFQGVDVSEMAFEDLKSAVKSEAVEFVQDVEEDLVTLDDITDDEGNPSETLERDSTHMNLPAVHSFRVLPDEDERSI